MKRADLIKLIWERNKELRLKESEYLVKLFFEEIERALLRDERVELRGFGTFGVRYRKGRNARNPKTGEEIALKSRRVPYFRISKKLSGRMNEE